jgi:Flp pilus assembly protein TadD
MARGDYDTAAAAYRSALEESPDDLQAHLGLAQAYNRSNRFAYAVPVLGHAIQIAPASSQAHFHLAYSLDRLGQPQAALQEYLQATWNPS